MHIEMLRDVGVSRRVVPIDIDAVQTGGALPEGEVVRVDVRVIDVEQQPAIGPFENSTFS